jgi:hypothetical protein
MCQHCALAVRVVKGKDNIVTIRGEENTLKPIVHSWLGRVGFLKRAQGVLPSQYSTVLD